MRALVRITKVSPKDGARAGSVLVVARFALVCGSIEIPGAVMRRENGSAYCSFGGKFPWEVVAGFPPFTFRHGGQDRSFELFFGIPQMVCARLSLPPPGSVAKYAHHKEKRNCGNCHYAVSEYDPEAEGSARSTVTCAVSALVLSGENKRFPSERTYLALRRTTCEAHTRRAFQEVLSLEARKPGQSHRWVPAEHRRLLALNPAALVDAGDEFIFPGDLHLRVVEE